MTRLFFPSAVNQCPNKTYFAICSPVSVVELVFFFQAVVVIDMVAIRLALLVVVVMATVVVTSINDDGSCSGRAKR